MNKALRVLALLAILSLFGLGISSTASKAASDAVNVDATIEATPEGTPEPVQLGNGLKIENVHSDQHVDKPGIEVKIDKPVMSGDESLTVKSFNAIIDKVIENTANAFTANTITSQATATLPPDIPGGDNFIYVDYEVTNASDKSNIVSIKFNVAWYSRGAAHPNSYSLAVNYDLKQARQLELADLFMPKVDYLDALSKYTIKLLKEADKLEFPEGAEPKPENFRSWNITAIGLQINFDDYQVTSHATGPQTVIVPYTLLKGVIDPAGPLAEFIK